MPASGHIDLTRDTFLQVGEGLQRDKLNQLPTLTGRVGEGAITRREMAQFGSYDSVNDLTTDTSIARISNGSHVLLTAYYDGEPFGQPIALIIEAAAAGVLSHTLSDGRYANLYADGILNVKWFGAKGDTTHSLSWDAASNNPSVSDEPSGTNDTAAFQAALSALSTAGGGTLLVPSSAGWYKVYGGIQSDKSDWLTLAQNVNLVGDGAKIYIWPQGASIGASGSQGFTCNGDNIISGLTFDGSAQETPVNVSLSEQTFYRTIYADGSADNRRKLVVRDCTFYNACGNHITGPQNAIDNVFISNCYFSDYKDHAVYALGRYVSVTNCSFIGNKDDTTREAVKVISQYKNSLLVDNCRFVLPNAIGYTIDGRGTRDTGLSTEGNGDSVIISNCSFRGKRFGAGAWDSGSDGIWEDILITNNHAICTEYGVIIGLLSTAANVNNYRLIGNYIECVNTNLISSGGTNGSGDFADRKISRAVISGNTFSVTSVFIGWYALAIKGSVDSLVVENNQFIRSATGATSQGCISYLWTPTPFAPDESTWIIRNNNSSGNYGTWLEFSSPGTAISAMPIDIRFYGNYQKTTNPPNMLVIQDLATYYAAGVWSGKLTVARNNTPRLEGGMWDWPDDGETETYLDEGYIFKKKVTLTAAEVTALNTTPKILVPPPGVYSVHANKPYFVGLTGTEWVDLTSTISLTGDFTVSFRAINPDVTTRQAFLGDTSGTAQHSFYIINGYPGYRRAANPYEFTTITILPDTEYLYTFERVGTDVTCTVVGGGTTQTETLATVVLTTMDIVRIASDGVYEMEGVIYDININGVAAYAGDSNSAAGWVDTIGSNDGTINGTPQNVGDVASIYDAGLYTVVDDITFRLNYSADFTGANNLEFRYNDGSGDKVVQDIPAATLNNAGDTTYMCGRPTTPPIPPKNASIVAYVPVADPGGGAGNTVELEIFYRILNP